MKPNPLFAQQPMQFWAYIRAISETAGYTERLKKGRGPIKIPSAQEMKDALRARNLDPIHIVNKKGATTTLGKSLVSYYQHRAEVLNDFVEPNLMDVKKAARLFKDLKVSLKPACPIPMNKQKGNKKAPAYFTSIINMLIESTVGDRPCNYDPRRLTTMTTNGQLLRTFARRMDGAFPSTVNPIAVWEIKEYYYTTTFGSRVAGGVYETLLDGMELEELKENEGVEVKHYLMIDGHYTWWDCGRSYLCRIVDLLHMGYVDEVFFGYEVISELPRIAKEWVSTAEKRGAPPA